MLVDTSYWIELLRQTHGIRRFQPDELGQLVTCPPIVQEVLQGLRFSPTAETFREGFLSIPRVGDPVKFESYLFAAEIFREGRRKGYTIRSSVDCLIAAIAIQNQTAVLHRDRDFSIIAKFTELRETQSISKT